MAKRAHIGETNKQSRLLHVVAIGSLLTCIVCAGAWAFGAIWPSDFIVARAGRIFHLGVRDGHLQLTQAGGHYEDRPLTWLPYAQKVVIGERFPETQWSIGIIWGAYGPTRNLGYGEGSLTPNSYSRYWSCGAHLAVPTFLAAVPPAIRLFSSHQRRYRIARGRCPNCGYDLRMLTSGRCPECGTALHRLTT